jgi:hypothetical protein
MAGAPKRSLDALDRLIFSRYALYGRYWLEGCETGLAGAGLRDRLRTLAYVGNRCQRSNSTWLRSALACRVAPLEGVRIHPYNFS